MSATGSYPKVVDEPTLLALRARAKADGRTVVWTNGCFDLLHVGHVRNLQAAKRLGDLLVVGLNSDRSVRQLKGPERPVNSEADRAEVLAGLGCVDYVVLFDDLDPGRILARVQPDIHCKGADYAPPHGKPIPEAGVIAAYGGRIEFLPLVPGKSTTNLVEQLRGAEGSGHADRG